MIPCNELCNELCVHILVSLLLVYALKDTQATPRLEVMKPTSGPETSRLGCPVVRGFTCIPAHFYCSFDSIFGSFLVKVAAQ